MLQLAVKISCAQEGGLRTPPGVREQTDEGVEMTGGGGGGQTHTFMYPGRPINTMTHPFN